MSDARLVVLGFLAESPLHGYELESRIVESNARIWAKIGRSTIYKTLSDLERSGSLQSRTEKGDRGSGRTRFSITAKGRRELSGLIERAIKGKASVYNPRIPGLIFCRHFRGDIDKMLSSATHILTGVSEDLNQQADHSDSRLRQIILRYHPNLAAAEAEASRAISEWLEEAR